MITYGLTEERYTLGNQTRVSCGIAAYADALIDGTATVVASVQDITNDKEKLTQVVDACNRLGLSVDHLMDVVEDFLSV